MLTLLNLKKKKQYHKIPPFNFATGGDNRWNRTLEMMAGYKKY